MKLLPALAAILFSGCALVPTQFDSTLYDHIVVLSESVDNAAKDCGTPGMASQAEMLNYQSKVILKYTTFTSKDAHDSVALVDKAITELNTIYQAGTPSTTYCKLKLRIIDADLHEVLTAVGGKHK